MVVAESMHGRIHDALPQYLESLEISALRIRTDELPESLGERG